MQRWGGSLLRRVGSCAAVVVSAWAVASCAATGTGTAAPPVLEDDSITIGSFDFAESHLLAEIYGQALEAHGIDVHLERGVGPREIVLPALSQGLVEFVPEYLGAALHFLSMGTSRPSPLAEENHAAITRALTGRPLVALRPSPAQNSNAFVVNRTIATRYRLRSISDLAAVASSLTFGGPPECPARPFCLLGLQRVYGIRFEHVLTLDAGGPLTQSALRDRQIDVALMFSTDPHLVRTDLVVLADDRGLQPADNITPLVRAEVVERWGEQFVGVVDDVSGRLTTGTLRRLNARMAADDLDPAAVARSWLTAEGIL
jgi:osmoprotectant transport system substrate-binding protein